jgi:putative RNA 2'-phosphotransferase
MISKEKTTRISKFLSMVLRHKPENVGIVLDENGWTDVRVLLRQLNAHGQDVSLDVLKHVVDTNEKKRFAFNEDFSRIRANQGHSVAVSLDYAPQEPPAALYHGTAEGFVASILATGLNKRSRHHVHLSTDITTATAVGQRQGKPVVFVVSAGEMHKAGFEFFVSDNHVWLTDHVPAAYLKRLP